MDLSWLKEMQESLNIAKAKSDISIKHPEYKEKENEIAILNRELDSIDINIEKYAGYKKSVSLAMFILFIFLLNVGVNFFINILIVTLASNSIKASLDVRQRSHKRIRGMKQELINKKYEELKSIKKMVLNREKQYRNDSQYVGGIL